jgi:hypothetical protein
MPGTAGLYRTALLRDIPIDLGMTAYYEDNDWSLRVERARPGSLRRCREAIAVHRTPTPAPASSSFSARAQAVRRVQAHAHFFRTHGLVMYGDLETVVPALRRDPGSPDVTAARLLLELVGARGAAWTLAEWMGGRLDALTGAHHAELTQLRAREAGLQEELRRAGEWERRATAAEHALAAETERVAWLVARHETLTRVEQGGWWRLRGRLLWLARR